MFVGIAAGIVLGIVAGIVSNSWIVFFLVPIFTGAISFLSYRLYAARKVGALKEKIVNATDMSIDRETFEMLNEMGQDILNIENQIQKISSLKHQLTFMFAFPMLAALLAELVIYLLKILFLANG